MADWREHLMNAFAVLVGLLMLGVSWLVFVTAAFGGRLDNWREPENWLIWISILSPLLFATGLALWEGGIVTKRATSGVGVRRLLFLFAGIQFAMLLLFALIEPLI